jgi:hypothetical protein
MRIINANINANRDTFPHELHRKWDYAQGLRSERTWKPGTVIIPKPKIKEGKPDWEDYHNSLVDEMMKVKMTHYFNDHIKYQQRDLMNGSEFTVIELAS